MKNYFFTGLITLLPLIITCIVISMIFNFLTTPFAGIMETVILSYEKHLGLQLENHSTLVMICSRFLALIILGLLIFILGFFGKKFLIKLFLKVTDHFLSHIPLVRPIYKMSLDLTKAILTDSSKTFKETLLVPFPGEASYALGFTTGPVPKIFEKHLPEGITLFVPTAPHPMSGFVLLYPKEKTLSTEISVDEAFKFLISCGSMRPQEAVPEEESKKKQT